MSFRDYLQSKNFFEKMNNSLSDISRQMNDLLNDKDDIKIINNVEDIEDVTPLEEDDEKSEDEMLDNLTDVEDIDSDLDKAQKEAGDPEELEKDSENDVSNDENDTPKRKRKPRANTVELKSFRNASKSRFYKNVKKACEDFNDISVNKKNGFDIPTDKKSISMGEMHLVSFGYQIPTEVFNQEMDGNLENVDKLLMLDNTAVVNTSSDYFGVSFFLRGDFVIADTNTDSYAKDLFNEIAQKLKDNNKLTYDCFKSAILNKIKQDQTINDDVIIGYMKVFNFANYLTSVIDNFNKNKKIPIIVSDNENLTVDDIINA